MTTATASRLRSWLLGSVPGTLLLSGLLGAGIGLALDSWETPRERQVRELCDRAVAAMLEGRDILELVRADMVIRNVGCLVRRRLPRPEGPG